MADNIKIALDKIGYDMKWCELPQDMAPVHEDVQYS